MSKVSSAPLGAEEVLLTFQLDGQLYAAPLSHVSEVIREHTVTPVPGSADDLLGICQLRGSIVPVMDGRRRLGLGSTTPVEADAVRVVIFSHDGSRVGFKVDAVGDLVQPAADAMTSPPARLRAIGTDDPVQAVFAWNGNFVALLDVACLVRVSAGGVRVD